MTSLSNIFSSGLGACVDCVRALVVAVLEKTVPASKASGLRVLDLLKSDDTSDARRRALQLALETVLANNSRLHRRIVSELRRVVFLESGPEFWPRARACVLAEIEGQSAVSTACQLVHEATHARLWRLGFRYSEDIRHRIEQICVKAELDLLARIPGTEALRDDTSRKLDNPWWTADEIRKRRKQDLKAILFS